MAITSIILSSLDGDNGFRVDGAAAGDYSGRSVSNAGDVNGDGFDDVIIGASRADPNGNYSGSSYVVFGLASGFNAAMDLSSLNGSNGFRLDGVAADDFSGISVSNVGDVNGDGFDDVIIGAGGADPNGERSGSSYVVFGKTSGFAAAVDLSSLDGNNGFRLDGVAVDDFSGASVSNAGDINGDGFDDVIIGGAQRDDDYSPPGSTVDYVVFGKASGFTPTLNLSDLDGSNGFQLDIDSYNARNTSVSSAGDINGDGYDDAIVGIVFLTPDGDYARDDASYVVFGKDSGFDAAVNLSLLNGSDGFSVTGVSTGQFGAGLAVSNAGDVNGDGFDDVIIGAPAIGRFGSDYYTGSSYVVFGKASGFAATIDLSSLDGNNGFRLDREGGGFGRSVSSAGDVNGDGFDDVIISSSFFVDQGSPSYVVFGRASGFDAVMNIFSLDSSTGVRLDGGSRVSGAGDVNGDGLDDLLVGDPSASPNGNNDAGSSYIIFGSRRFEGTVTYVGTPDDDILTGTAADERFEGGDGNDTMIGGGGADIFAGGDGDDTIRVPDLAFQILHGGFGTNTLELTGGGIDLNLANFHERINFIDIIDLTGSGDNTLTLTLAGLLSLSLSEIVKVNGDAGDRVVIRGGGWMDGGIDGDYQTYTNFGDVVLQIDVAVSTNPPTLGGVFSLSSLNGSNGFRLDGEKNDFSGSSVSNAGDVNGDGFDDVIIGAPGSRFVVPSSPGSSYVVFGRASGFDAAMNLSSLDGSNGFRLDGEKNDRSGSSVSNAGDVNGDGFDDVIIGARGSHFADPSSPGSSYVVFGKAAGFAATLDLSGLDGSNGFRVDGAAASDFSGISVSSAGDVNGDGFDDVIVGATGADPNGNYSGASYVVFGRASGFDAALNLSSLDGSNGFRLDGVAAYDGAGESVSNAGDVNGDGFDDVIVGATGADPNGDSSGSSYVVFGKATGFAAAVDLSSLDGSNGFRLDGAADNRSGVSVSNAGDVNGDGFDDVIIGDSGEGSSYVVFGRASGFDATLDLSALNGNNGFRLDEVTYGSSGTVSSAGDVNGDGFADLLVGGSLVDRYQLASYVVFGKASGFAAAVDLSSLDGINGIRLDGTADDYSGAPVSGAGDVNGDGFDDLMAGDPGAGPNGDSSGSSYVIFGSHDFGGAAPDIVGTSGDDNLTGTLLAERFEAGDGNDRMTGRGGADIFRGDSGDDVIGVPDLDFQIMDGGIGTDTLELMGSGINPNLGNLRGRINGIETIDLTGSGNNTLLLTLPDLLSLSETTDTFTVNGNLGDRVFGLIDGWEDGGIAGDYHVYRNQGAVLRVDTAVSTDWPKPGINLANLNGSNGFRLDGAGRSVSGAGDVNGDGFDDLIIGAYRADTNGGQTGASYVVFGKASGFDAAMNLSSLDGSNGFRLDGVAEDDRAGASVSNAGDVNGDGFDDLIVGAPGVHNSNYGDDAGASYVVFGKASGFDAAMDLPSLDGSNGFRLDGIAAYDSFGISVSSAGDVNGDGFDDLIIGASGADPNGDSSGSSYVVFGKATGFAAAVDLSSLDGSNGFRLDGAAADNYSGVSVSNAGDVNGDGFDDLLVGAHGADPNGNTASNSGASYVVFGRASGFGAALDLSSLDGTNGIRLDGVAANDVSGGSVSNAGDVNGDGFDDLMVGAPGADPNGESSGSSYVIFGRSDFGGGGEVIQGTPGNDKLTGTAAAEIFEAGDGNDRMIGRGGADVFHGDAGNDYIQVADLGFALVDGGSGNDVLHTDGKDLNLDLANFSGKIHGIETICLFGRGDNTLTLTAQDLLNLSDTDNTLKVNGNAGDHITVLDDGWVDEGNRGQGYFHVYTNDEAVLLVGMNVTIDFA